MTRLLTSYTDPIKARIVLGLLQSEGIDASLDGEHMALANWEWRIATGGIRLRVPEAQWQRARDVLTAHECGDFAIDDDAAPTHVTMDTEDETPSSRLAWLSLFLLGLPLPWRRRAHRNPREGRRPA